MKSLRAKGRALYLPRSDVLAFWVGSGRRLKPARANFSARVQACNVSDWWTSSLKIAVTTQQTRGFLLLCQRFIVITAETC